MAGSGYIEKRGKGSYQLTVNLGKGKDGKYIRKRKTVKARNKTIARSLLDDFKQELKNDEYVAPSNTCFVDFIPRWKQATVKQVTPKTMETYMYVMNARILPEFGHITMENISHVQITAFLEKLKQAGLSAQTIKKHNIVLRSVFNYAVWADTIKTNPMDKVKLPRMDHGSDDKIGSDQIYTPQETEQLYHLLDQEENRQMALIIKTALKTGMRKGEILGLQVSDLDYNQNIIHIKHSLSYTKANGKQLKTPKTKGSNRKIGVPAALMKELKALAEQKYGTRDKVRELWQGDSQLFVFSATFGQAFYPSVPSQWFRRFLKRTGFKKIRFHDLRHTFSSNMIANGVNINKLSKYLGHKSASVTTDVYGHLLPDDTEIPDMVERIL